jgi:predicted MFS family arabinose efflux permease
MGPIIMRLADGPTRARIFSWNVALLLGSGAAWTAGAGALPAALERALGVTLLGGVRSVLALGALLTVLAGLVQALVQVPAAPSAASLAGQRARWLGALPGPRILVAVAAVAVWMCAGGLVIPFFNVYFARVHELPVARIGMVFALAQTVTAGVLLASGAAAGKVGARRMLVLWMLVFAPALWALAATSLLPLALALFLLQGLVSPATNPLIDQVLLDATAPDRHGVVSSWRNAATETSGLVGAALGGVLLARSSFTALFTVAGAVAAAGAGLVLLALRYSLAESDTRRRTIRSSLSA